MESVKESEFGAGLKVRSTCEAGHSYTWESCTFYNEVPYFCLFCKLMLLIFTAVTYMKTLLSTCVKVLHGFVFGQY
jgi:hypothetical protein